MSWQLTSTLSNRQLVHGNSSTTLQRTFRALQLAQALAARLFVTLAAPPSAVALESLRFFLASPFLLLSGGGEPAADVSEASDVIVMCELRMRCSNWLISLKGRMRFGWDEVEIETSTMSLIVGRVPAVQMSCSVPRVAVAGFPSPSSLGM